MNRLIIGLAGDPGSGKSALGKYLSRMTAWSSLASGAPTMLKPSGKPVA